MGGNKSVRAYERQKGEDRVKKRERERERETPGGGNARGKRKQMGEGEEMLAHELVCRGTYHLWTEINQGCTQISKRKITKINRPDVQCDKKSSPALLFLIFLVGARSRTRNDRLYDRIVGFISITPIVPIKFR